MKKTLGIILLCALAFCGGGFMVYQLDITSKADQPISFLQKREDPAASQPRASAAALIGQNIGALGRIEPQSEVLDIDAAIGDRLLRLLVIEGQQVHKGQELAYLESYDVRVAEKKEIAARLEEAQRQQITAKDLGQARVHKAELNFKMVVELEPVRLQVQKAEIRRIEAELANAQSEFKRSTGLRGKNLTTEEAFDRKQLAVRSLKESLSQAKLSLAEMTLNRTLSLQVTQAALQESRAQLEETLAAIPVQSLIRKLALAEANLQRTIIRAPISGQILNIFTWPGERIGSDPILQMGNTQEIHVVAEVYETDIQRIQIGQRATIHSPALPESITGEVMQIGHMVFKNDVLDVDPVSDTDARVVEARIRLEKPEWVRGLTHLQVDVLIDVSTTSASAHLDSRGAHTR